jgi:hypothetical protein
MKLIIFFFIYSLLFLIFQFSIFAHIKKNNNINCLDLVITEYQPFFKDYFIVKGQDNHFTKQKKNL